ncbi:hypothetical protein [Chryseosolibacter indicus]|nr:hypothetical protein [Chryseosolibacter indicus]
MSFFLAEVAMLGIDKNSTLVKTFVTSGLEEEKETNSSGESGGDDIKEVILSLEEHICHYRIICTTETQRNKIFSNIMTLDGHKQIFSPPPEFHTA